MPCQVTAFMGVYYPGSYRPNTDVWPESGGNSLFMKVTLEKAQGPETTERGKLSPASKAVARYLADQVDAILDGDAGLRRGEDPIHDTRVAIRRTRSTLRVFGGLFEPASADPMESDLKWFAALLGEVRDCQVQALRFYAAVSALPDTLVMGPGTHSHPRRPAGGQVPARERVAEAMASPGTCPCSLSFAAGRSRRR